jgi:hypothetical protein
LGNFSISLVSGFAALTGLIVLICCFRDRARLRGQQKRLRFWYENVNTHNINRARMA